MTARQWLGALVAAIVVTFAVVVVTGVLLSLFYVPDASTNDGSSLWPVCWRGHSSRCGESRSAPTFEACGCVMT
jgi:hypothetical protein